MNKRQEEFLNKIKILASMSNAIHGNPSTHTKDEIETKNITDEAECRQVEEPNGTTNK